MINSFIYTIKFPASSVVLGEIVDSEQELMLRVQYTNLIEHSPKSVTLFWHILSGANDSSLPEDAYFMLKHLSCKSNPCETFCIIRGSRLSWRRLETRVDFKGGDGETYEDEVDSQRFLHTESEGKLRGQNSLEVKLASRTSPPFYAKQALCHPKEKMDIGLILPSSQPVPASGWSPQFLATAV